MIALVGRTREEMDYARLLGMTIKEQREKLHMRQVDIAAVLGITPTTLSRWETGSAMPTAWHLRRLSEQLALVADVLLFPPEQVPTALELRLRQVVQDGLDAAGPSPRRQSPRP